MPLGAVPVGQISDKLLHHAVLAAQVVPGDEPSRGRHRMANRLAQFLCAVATGFMPATATAGRMSYLDNGTIRIGVDLDLGGSITHLSRSGGGENLINSHDLGRQI